MSYEILIEEREPIDGWTVCTVCLSVERTAKVWRGRWRCPDCGVDTSNNSQRTVADEVNPVARSFAFDVEEGTYEERAGNRNGHVLEWLETDGIAGDDFYWRVFLVAGDPEAPATWFAGYDKAGACPR